MTRLLVHGADRMEPTGIQQGGTVSQVEDDLKATTDAIIADAEELTKIEHQKRNLDTSDPRMRELSREAERVARQIHTKTVAERSLADMGRGSP